jgi:hypothetical protein
MGEAILFVELLQGTLSNRAHSANIAYWPILFGLLLFINAMAVLMTIRELYVTRQIRRAMVGVYSTVMLMATTVLLYAGLYQNLRIQRDGKITTDGIDCIYFSIVTWTTLGYGDIVPSQASRLAAASEAVVGYFFMAIFIAFTVQLMAVAWEKVPASSAGSGRLD